MFLRHTVTELVVYPAIGDALDEDLSGFISPNEVRFPLLLVQWP